MMTDRLAALRAAVAAQGLVPGEARRRRGQARVTLVWLRPEPVTLRVDAANAPWLESYLPWVIPGGTLHRRIKAFLAAQPFGATCASRGGHLSLGVRPEGGPAEAVPRLLGLARTVREMLDTEWPDYARGVFAPPPGRGGDAGTG